MIIPACSPDPEHAPGVRLTHATLAAVAAPGTRLPNRAHWLVDSGPRLTGSAKETLALVANGIHSAQQITRIDRTLFAEQHKEIFSVERANDIYNRAQRTHALALALFADHAAGLDRTGLHALPKVNSQKQADLAADSVPDWHTLFGTFDFCACEECASVHGPAVFKPQDEDFRLRPDGQDNGACGGALPRRTTPTAYVLLKNQHHLSAGTLHGCGKLRCRYDASSRIDHDDA